MRNLRIKFQFARISRDSRDSRGIWCEKGEVKEEHVIKVWQADRQAGIGRDQQSVLRVGVSVRRICDLKLLGKVTFYNTPWPSRAPFRSVQEAK